MQRAFVSCNSMQSRDLAHVARVLAGALHSTDLDDDHASVATTSTAILS